RCARPRDGGGTPPADPSCHRDLGLAAEITPLAPAPLRAPAAGHALGEERRRTLGARLLDGTLPQHELAVGIGRAAEERPALARAALDDLPLAARLRARDTERDGLGRLALRIARARDELAEAPMLDDHRAFAGRALLVGRLVLRPLVARQVLLVLALRVGGARDELAEAAPALLERLATLRTRLARLHAALELGHALLGRLEVLLERRVEVLH